MVCKVSPHTLQTDAGPGTRTGCSHLGPSWEWSIPTFRTLELAVLYLVIFYHCS